MISNNSGVRLLVIALKSRQAESARTIIERGCSEASCYLEFTLSSNLLTMALEIGDKDLIAALVDKGMCWCEHDRMFDEILTYQGTNISVIDRSFLEDRFHASYLLKATALHKASAAGNERLVRLMLTSKPSHRTSVHKTRKAALQMTLPTSPVMSI